MTNTKTTKRQVRINLHHGVYFVEYVDRKPRQRYLAAQFAADMLTRGQVEQWIAEQPNLTLVVSDDSKSYFALGQSKTIGVLVRCADRDAADYELDLLRQSDCHRITRTSRPATESEAMAWFPTGLEVAKRERK
jgi:hypothetical protein